MLTDRKHQARKSVPFLRVLGNLLILTGVLLLLGIGGWWGSQMLTIQQDYQDFSRKGVVVDPTIDARLAVQATPDRAAAAAAAVATATPTVVIAFQSLNVTPTPAASLINSPKAAPVRDDSPPIRLTIPSVKIDSKVVPVGWSMIPKPGGGMTSEWDVAAYAVGHHAGSSNPGQPGNVVMSGHVDYKGEVFKNLHDVSKGDQVTIQTEKGQYMYVITDMYIVQQDGASEAQKQANARFMDQTPDSRLTLITCYPYGIDDKRFIAIGRPYQPATSLEAEFSLR